MQPFLNTNSVSVSQVPAPDPVEEIVPEVAVPIDNKTLVEDPLMDTNHPGSPPGEVFWASQLESILATGQITLKKVAPPSVMDSVGVSPPDPLLGLSEETSSKNLVPSELPEEASPEFGFQDYDSWE